MKQVFTACCAILLLCSGCASTSDKPKMVILQDPQTMEFVDCKVSDGWATEASYAKNEECVAAYKKKGYTVWAER